MKDICRKARVRRSARRSVRAVAARVEARLLEVHRHEALVGLDHAVLEARVDAELRLDRQDEIRQQLERHVRRVQRIEAHERPYHGRHDGRRPREAHLPRHVRLVGEREVPLRQRDAAVLAELQEPLARGLQQAHAALVALPPRDEVQIREAAEVARVEERVRHEY